VFLCVVWLGKLDRVFPEDIASSRWVLVLVRAGDLTEPCDELVELPVRTGEDMEVSLLFSGKSLVTTPDLARVAAGDN